jgi:hypothetical protein
MPMQVTKLEGLSRLMVLMQCHHTDFTSTRNLPPPELNCPDEKIENQDSRIF